MPMQAVHEIYRIDAAGEPQLCARYINNEWEAVE